MRVANSLLAVGLLAAASGPVGADGVTDPSTALRDYLVKPDDSYRWERKRTGRLKRTEFAELMLVSQTWRDITWKHQLFIIKPMPDLIDSMLGT